MEELHQKDISTIKSLDNFIQANIPMYKRDNILLIMMICPQIKKALKKCHQEIHKVQPQIGILLQIIINFGDYVNKTHLNSLHISFLTFYIYYLEIFLDLSS